MNSMKGAPVSRVDESGQSTAVTAPQSAEARPPAATSPTTVGTSGQAANATARNNAKPHNRTRLPQTASNLTMFEWLSGLMLVAGLGVRRLRTHGAGR
jgi:hypothetical protein